MGNQGSVQGNLLKKDIMNMTSCLLPFDWQSTDAAHEYCGISLMRHMEAYMGVKKWDCGLKKNDVSILILIVFLVENSCFLLFSSSDIFLVQNFS